MKKYEITNIRAIATILVLIGHCLYAFCGFEWTFNVEYSEYANFINSYIYTFHMAVFFIVSGFLFQLAYVPKVEYVSFADFFKKRFVRLIIPLLFVKFAICNIVNLIIGRYPSLFCRQAFFELGHLWYLLTLFVISILMYFIFRLVKSTRGGVLYLSLLALGIIMALISDMIPNFGVSAINSIFYYFVFFLLGMIICKYELLNYVSNKKIMLLALSINITLFGVIRYFENPMSTMLKIVLALFGSLVWIGIIYRLKENKLLTIIDNYGMGIYLLHFPIIYLLLHMIENLNIGVSISIILLFTVSFILSIGITKLLRIFRCGALLGEN